MGGRGLTDELLTVAQVCELLDCHRSTLHRWEGAGRIVRARTRGRRPLYRACDVRLLAGKAADDVDEDELQEDDDVELTSLRAQLSELLAAGELDGTASLRLVTAVLRRELALRVARGEEVSVLEALRLESLSLKLHHREQYEQLRALTRTPAQT